VRILLLLLTLLGLGVGLVLNSDLLCARVEPPVAGPEHRAARVGVLGASAGVRDALPLAAYLSATLPPESQVFDHTDPDLSRSPRARGASAVAALEQDEPTLVVAVDFVFWFAHSVRLSRARRDAVAQALGLLDRFECPLVLGDLPSLATHDLLAESRPGATELAALNAEIRAWAAERENVEILPLSGTEALRKEWLQDDGLHPNAAGLEELSKRTLAVAGLGELGWRFDPARLATEERGQTGLRIDVVNERGERIRDGELRFSFRGADLLTSSGADLARLLRWRELAEPQPLADANPFERNVPPTEQLPGGIVVWAEAPGYIPTDRVPVVLRTGRETAIRLVTPDPHSLEVRAFDSETGEPVEGVLVASLTELERRGLDPRWSEPTGRGAGARTNSEGRAWLPRLAPRPQRLELQRSGYQIRRAEPVQVDGSLALPLHPLKTGSRATIRVSGPNGEALEGAAVGLIVEGAEAARWERVGADGFARFTGLPLGNALVHLPDWLALRRARGWHAPNGGLSQVRAQLDRRALEIDSTSAAQATLGFLSDSDHGGTLRVRVLGLDGNAVAGVGALLKRPDGAFGIAAVSDDRGEFAIFGVPPGNYLLDAGGSHQEVVMTQGSTRATIDWLTDREAPASTSN